MSSRSTQIIGGPDREHAHVDTSTNALLVKVVNPGGASSNVNIDQVGGVSIGSTVPVSDGGGSLTVDGTVTVVQATHDNLNLNANLQVGNADVGVGNPVPVSGTFSTTLGGLVSTGNTTTTPLSGGATYTGTWEDTRDYATLTITAYANVASATGGWKLQWSSDGSNVDKEESLTLSAASGRALAINVRSRYFRTVYTNGASAQSAFRLGTVYRPSGAGMNNYTLTQTLSDTTLAIMTRSVIVGETTGGGGGGYHNVKVTPSGALTVEISDGGGSITVDGTVAATQSGAWTVSVNEPVSIDDNGGSITVDGTVAVSSVSGTVVVGDGGGSLTVDGTVAATQSGAWTVSVNEPVSIDDNGSSITVDGTVAVSSVAGTVVVGDGGGSLTVDGTVGISGTVTVADGGGSLTVDGSVSVSNFPAVQPVSDNGGSLTVDGTVAVSSISGNVTVVDGGGSLTIDGSVSITGTVDTGLGKAEDAVHASGDIGVMSLSVRKDTAATTTGADGDYAPLITGSDGRLHTRTRIWGRTDQWDADVVQDLDKPTSGYQFSGLVPMYEINSAPTGGDPGDVYHATLDEANFGLRVHLAGTDTTIGVNAVVPGTGATNLGKAEDVAHVSGDVGVMMLAVRQDTLAALAGTSGDYIPLTTDSLGRLNVRESGVTTVALSGSTRGRPIQIAATSSPGTTLHTATTTTGQLDRVYVYLTNTSASAVLVTIEFGTTGSGNEMDIIVPANDTIVAVDGAVIGGGLTDTITAYAATTNVINAFGRIERLS